MPEMRIEKYGTYKTKNHNICFIFQKKIKVVIVMMTSEKM